MVTDPPFFDNAHYSQLADFFFYWLNDLLDLSDIQTTRHQATEHPKQLTLFESLGDYLLA